MNSLDYTELAMSTIVNQIIDNNTYMNNGYKLIYSNGDEYTERVEQDLEGTKVFLDNYLKN